jgi:hypothetical protein
VGADRVGQGDASEAKTPPQLARFGGIASRSLLAAAAGEDLILAATTNPKGNSPAIGLSTFHALAAAIAANRLGQAAARSAAARVLALRARP